MLSPSYRILCLIQNTLLPCLGLIFKKGIFETFFLYKIFSKSSSYTRSYTKANKQPLGYFCSHRCSSYRKHFRCQHYKFVLRLNSPALRVLNHYKMRAVLSVLALFASIAIYLRLPALKGYSQIFRSLSFCEM